MRRALLLVLVLIPLATACGAGDALTTLDPIAEAANKTRDVESARFVLQAKIRDATEGNITMSGPGEIDDHGRVMHMKLTMPAAQLGLSGRPVTLDMLAKGSYFYFRGGPFDRILRGGKKWVRIRDDAPIANLGQNDPATMLEYLTATSDVEKVGEGHVRGIATARYHARIQLSKVAERLSPEAKRQFDQLASQAGDDTIKEIPLDVWVDREGFVRRLTMDWHLKGGSIVFNMEFFDFGANVGLKIPPTSTVKTIQVPDE